MVNDPYACFDDFSSIVGANCQKRGLFKHGESTLTSLTTFVNTLRNQILDGESKRGLLWSHELGLSASEYMEDLDGCAIWQPNLLDDGNMHEYLREIASFDDHIRFTVYPERFRWSSEKEAVWDWILDDSSPNFD